MYFLRKLYENMNSVYEILVTFYKKWVYIIARRWEI